MKRILAVFIALGAMSSLFAQSEQRNRSRDVIPGQGNNRTLPTDRRYNHITARERDREISRINQEYDSRIRAVRWNRYMRNSEKKREIRILEARRASEIRRVRERYDYSNHNDRNGRGNRRY